MVTVAFMPLIKINGMKKVVKELDANLCSDIRYYSVKKVTGHKCNLVEEVDTVAKSIKSGWFVPLRRHLKRKLMISENSNAARAYVRSTCRLKLEEMRHLDRYYYMIHPLSDGCYYWQSFMAVINLILLLMAPILTFVNLSPEDNTHTILYALNIFCGIDMIIQFYTGYYEHATDKIIMKTSLVAKRYLLSYFLPDLISTVHLNAVSYLTDWYEEKWYFNVQWGLRLVRIGIIRKNLDNFRDRAGFARYKFNIIKQLLVALVFYLWIIYLVYYIESLTNDKRRNRYDLPGKFTVIAHDVMANAMLVDTLSFGKILVYDSMVQLIGLHCGLFLHLMIAAQIFQIYNCFNTIEKKNQNMMNQISAYITFKELPVGVSSRIKRYINFRFQKGVLNEKLVMDSLSDNLKNEILWHTCQDLITKVDTFKSLPLSVMTKVVTLLKHEIFLPNDVVVQAGDVGSEMFFIYVGVLAVFTAAGKEICHLTDGAHFGEIALLLNETRVASVVAIDFCELFRLTKRDFIEAIEPYPAAKEILRAAQDRLVDTKKISGN